MAETLVAKGPRTPGRSVKPASGDGRLVDLVFSWIAEQIVLGSLGPGQWISESNIGDALGVSRSPVHQALQVLSAMHVVDVTPRRGTMIADPSAAEVSDLYDARGYVASQIAELAIVAWDHELSDRLTELSEEVKRVAGNNREYYDATTRFWDVLNAGCGNIVMAQLHEALWLRSIPIRGLVLQVSGVQQHNALLIEQLAQAIAARDIPTAKQAAVDLHKEMGKIALDVCFLPSDGGQVRRWRRPS